MPHLTYFVCGGITEGETSEDIHVDMCKMAIDSLYRFGEYTGEVMVITDREEDFDNVDYTVGLSPDWIKSINDIGRLKFLARQWMDPSRYDSIMYLDNDMLIMNDIQPVLGLPDEAIVISEEFPINMLNTNIPFLTDEEKKMAEGMVRINTGVFCIDSNIYLETVRKMLDYLNYCLENYEYRGVEQKPTNAMVVREELPYEPIPHDWVEFPLAAKAVGPPPVFSDVTKVLHFAGNANYAEKQHKAMKDTIPMIENRDYRSMRKIYEP